jgi:transcriptional regulator with XRE-family HTH domain
MIGPASRVTKFLAGIWRHILLWPGGEAGNDMDDKSPSIRSPVNLGQQIRIARKARGMTLAQLACAAATTENTVWELEACGSGSMALLARVADALSLEWTGTGGERELHVAIRAARYARGWSIKHTARVSGVSAAAVRRVEAGAGRIATLERLTAILLPRFRVRKGIVGRDRHSPRHSSYFSSPGFVAQVKHVLGDIELDPCGHEDDHVGARRRYTKADEGLARSWNAETVYTNPPYASWTAWLRRAQQAWETGEAEHILMLVPARTAAHSFHHACSTGAHCYVLRGRVQFWTATGPHEYVAPFASMVLLFSKCPSVIARAGKTFDAIHIPTPAIAA